MHTRLKLRLLLPREVKEPQCELATAITDAYKKVAAPAIGCFRKQHLTTHKAARTRGQRTDLYKLCSILVAQRQQEQKVFDPL